MPVIFGGSPFPTLTARTRDCATLHNATASVRPAAHQSHPLHKQQLLLVRMPLALENSHLGDLSHRLAYCVFSFVLSLDQSNLCN